MCRLCLYHLFISVLLFEIQLSKAQTWFYEGNKKVEIGNQKYWIYYKKGIATVKSRIKKRNSALMRTKIRSESSWNPINRFKTNTVLCLSKPEFGFASTYSMVFIVVDDLWWQVVVGFVDIGGIVDYHHLNYFFHNYTCCTNTMCIITNPVQNQSFNTIDA